jgi:eukaryotic-like serine/threonine-protein kinase
MTNNFWQKIEEIFPLVADLSGDERERRLNELCGDDGNLRREILLLLAADDEADDFIESPAVSPDLAMRALSVDAEKYLTLDLAGEKIGAYRVVRKIGEGGMGAVYLAERADGEFRKRAAIKLIKTGAQTSFNLRRFRRERQILAALEHQNAMRRQSDE